MLGIPGGMESDTDSDDCMIVHHPNPSDTRESTKYLPENDKISSNKRSSGEINKLSSNQLPNGNVINRHSSSSHSYQNNRKSAARQNQKSNGPKRHLHSVDHETSQFYEDFRFAVMHGNLDQISEFVEKGIQVDAVLKAGWTALMYACSCGHHEIVKYLLEKKADPNYTKDLFTPLMATCASTHDEESLLKCVQLLLQYGAQTDVQERHLASPLVFAAREGHKEIVKELLEHNAALDLNDNKGYTALHWAASYGHGQIVRLLLCKGSDPQKVTFGGQCAADLAYSEGHKEVASLLEKGSHQLSSIESNVLTQKEQNDLPSKDVCSASAPKNSYMSAEEYNAYRKSFKPLEKTKCYEKQSELDVFLTGLNLSDLTTVLNEQQVAFSDLLIMADEELEKVGVQQFGARKKILEATKAVHKKAWEASSLPNLKQYQYISCPDAVVMVANIAQHLKYIASSIVYVRQQIQAQPRILELGQDSSNVHDLTDETQESLKNVQVLYDELRFLKLHLDKVQDNVKYIPADLIVETVPISKARWKGAKMFVVLTVVTFTIGGVLWKKSDILSTLIPSFVGEKARFLKF